MPAEVVKPGCLGQFLAMLLGRRDGAARAKMPYRRIESLLTPAERSFYGALQQALAGRAVIVAIKVRLADLVAIEKGAEGRQGWLNRVTGKHVDFVICRSDTTGPILAIELDDKSHSRAERVDRDTFLDGCLAAAGLPLVRVAAARAYSVVELKAAIGRHLENKYTTNEPM
jgi:hypothetical protein